jgi:hypothetical protein
MHSHVLSAGALVLLAATVSCESGADDPTEEEPPTAEAEVALDLSVDRVDIVHGALRVSAMMREGSADVSILLGPPSERRDVGRGMATRTALVWALSERDLADALGCAALLVRARVATERGRHVSKVASLAVAADVAPREAEEGPRLQGVAQSTTAMSVVFTSARATARLSVGDNLLESIRSPNEVREGEEQATEFTVPHADFARALVSRAPLVLDGASFEPSLAIAGVALEFQLRQEEEEQGPEPRRGI